MTLHGRQQVNWSTSVQSTEKHFVPSVYSHSWCGGHYFLKNEQHHFISLAQGHLASKSCTSGKKTKWNSFGGADGAVGASDHLHRHKSSSADRVFPWVCVCVCVPLCTERNETRQLPFRLSAPTFPFFRTLSDTTITSASRATATLTLSSTLERLSRSLSLSLYRNKTQFDTLSFCFLAHNAPGISTHTPQKLTQQQRSVAHLSTTFLPVNR